MQVEGLIDVRTDFGSISLGDKRLNRRCRDIASTLQTNPSAAFTTSFADDAASEALYRFLGNPRVEWQQILDEHRDASWDRALDMEGRVLAVHDTTMCQFGGERVRKGAFRTSKGKSGFLAHTCMAVAADGSRQPLGIVGMLPVVRLDDEEASNSPGLTYGNEADRWADLVGIVEDERPKSVKVTHVMDSEGDAYDLLEFMVSQGFDFVIRMCHDRRVIGIDGAAEKLADSLAGATTMLTRTVPLSARRLDNRAPNKGRNTPRDERMATLELRATSAVVQRPDASPAHLAGLHLHLVHVVEQSPPDDDSAVEWVLATTHPVDTPEQVAAVVDAYRTRWLIEEWFKALKTGCAYQKRQLGSLDTLLTAFSLLAPIATRLLCIRWFARNEPKRTATSVLSQDELECLGIIERSKRRRFPKNPTVHDAMLAIARLGGFLKQNKTPGWLTLGRGYEEFQARFEMFELMKHAKAEM